ncbi:MAG: hypothetical protein FJ104_16225, partial [Deltaproteobacteria bacterium]|nr:hypothetical protein [Deltaproteobacteria bacterium]
DPEVRLAARAAENPTASRAHLELADLHLSRGEPRALERSLVAAVEAGAPTAALTAAIDLRSGRTELEPFRLQARDVIREFERSGVTVEGTAARVLDYAALFVRADGSSRMLEHEIVRIQSAEAASKLAEHRALEGDVLHLRVIKRDGSVLEPEVIAGKPTVTLPHLEIGDYVETEQILASAGDGRGARYAGPRWFFREENVGYARSELVLISPKSRPLVVETTGLVPEPSVEERDGLVIRRFRVDESPPAPVEPGSAPLAEFLPSLTLGWGQSLELRLGALADAMVQLAPVDPRVERLARELVEGIPARDVEARARRLYRFLAENVEPGEETDGRRVVFGRHGNLWQGFRMLCRAAGVPVRFAVAESRLATPPRGPLSEAQRFTQPVAEVLTPRGSTWLTLGGKYTPFGWLPSDLRGMRARLLDGSIGREVLLPEGGVLDSVELTGKGQLGADGSLSLELAQRFTGKLAMQLRRGLDQLPEERLHAVLETQMLAQTFRGGELQRHVVERRDELDAPLTIRMTVRVPRFAERAAGALVITPPFGADLARLATLPERRTPLLLSEALH